MGKEPVSIEFMKLREIGNSYGFTISKDALRELGLLGDNPDGELTVEDINVRSTVFDDGTVNYEIPVDDIDDN